MADDKDYKRDELLDDFSTLRSITGELINENAELKNALEVKERELALIYKLNRKITFSMEWEEIQEMVVDLITDFFPVVRFCLIALYSDDNELQLCMKGANAPLSSSRIRIGTELDENTQWDEIVATSEWNNYFSQLEFVKSLQSSFIPLAFNTHQMGFLMICKNKRVEYDKNEWRFLSTVANYVGMVLDNSRLDKISRTDSLTGLYNRWFFTHKVEREVARANKDQFALSLLMLDIDRFKRVNDTHGHPAGDQVLVELATRIKNFVPRADQVFRIGGEEIVVLCPGLQKDGAADRAEGLRTAIANTPFEVETTEQKLSLDITISIGVACYPDDAHTVHELISRADQALYRAKARGRNKVEIVNMKA